VVSTMMFEIKSTVRSVTVEITSSQMPPTDQVMEALRERFRSIHPLITVRNVPPRSVSVDEETTVEISVSFDPDDGVRLNADLILSTIDFALYHRFGYAVSSTNNLSHRL